MSRAYSHHIIVLYQELLMTYHFVFNSDLCILTFPCSGLDYQEPHLLSCKLNLLLYSYFFASHTYPTRGVRWTISVRLLESPLPKTKIFRWRGSYGTDLKKWSSLLENVLGTVTCVFIIYATF